MIRLLLLSSFIACFFTANAQQISRIIASQTNQHNGTAWAINDSASIYYKPGNLNPGDADSFLSSGSADRLKPDSLQFYFYNAGSYKPGTSRGYTYDAHNNITEIATGTYSSGTWQNTERNLYAYNTSNFMTEFILQTWSTTTNNWVNYERNVYTYSGNELTNDSYQKWSTTSNSWVNFTEYIYTYTAGKMVMFELRVWNTGTSAWDNSERRRYTYHANGMVDSIETQKWQKHLATWRNYTREITIYNGLNMAGSIFWQNWDTVANGWVNDRLYRYVYSSANAYTGDTVHTWSKPLNKWVYESASNTVGDTMYRYNWYISGNTFLTVSRDITKYNSYNQVTRRVTERWYFATSSWGMSFDRDDTYYYGMADLGIGAIDKGPETLSIYPSPANNNMNLRTTWKTPKDCKIAIHDMNGRLLRQWQEAAATSINRTIPVADLVNGIYNISITTNDSRTTRQFIISR